MICRLQVSVHTHTLSVRVHHQFQMMSSTALCKHLGGVWRPLTAGRACCSSHHQGNITLLSSRTTSKGQAKSEKAETILSQDIHLFNRKERKAMTEFGGNVVNVAGRKESSLDIITSSTKLPCVHTLKPTLYQRHEAAFTENQNVICLIAR